MYTQVTTLTDFLLEEERKHLIATGSFTLLMLQIENAAKIINSHIRASGLVDILGKTGGKNVYDDEIMKLDELSNSILVDMLKNSGQVHTLVSEELAKEMVIPASHAGEYIVYFDPLDGSSNIDTNSPIGTIFSIYHKNGGLLQKGRNQVAAGYIMYGSSTIFVYTSGHGTHGFTLDPAIGSFLLSFPHMHIPPKASMYSINEGNRVNYPQYITNYLEHIESSGAYKLRYVGSLIAEVQRTLIKGGIFLYPTDTNHPQGKERLMIEANPMAFLIEQAGGKALAVNNPVLDIQPSAIQQYSPVVLGSKENIDEYLRFV